MKDEKWFLICKESKADCSFKNCLSADIWWLKPEMQFYKWKLGSSMPQTESVKDLQPNWLKANFAYIAGIELFLNKHDGVRLNGENSPVLQYIWTAVNPAQTCNSG